ncbi:MAG: MBOAT family protein [Lachnospiraceae bacterium]|nr:MBOAT family protein [Lachnospiraceae bacterium]
MALKSFGFVLFITLFLIVYFLAGRVVPQRWIVLAFSLYVVLRATGPVSLAVLLVVCTMVWAAGRIIARDRKSDPGRAGLWYLIGLVFCIGVLLYFKFLTPVYDGLAAIIANRGGVSLPEIAAPIGLSYYALSLAAYLTDIRYGKHEAEESLTDLFAYAMYFPALFQGPINLYKDLMPQLKENHSFDQTNLVYGLQRLLWGYVKKAVIADRIGILVTGMLGDENVRGAALFFAMVLYSFQIYADFSGGIDVIMGVSETMGITLKENFRAPLISHSVTEYWQRWHMTLGTIMEKYLYYPIVLSKRMRRLSKKIKSKYLSRVFAATVATFIVFVLVGIWHGTGWNYVVYGLYQAFFTSTAILLGPVYKRIKEILHIHDKNPVWSLFTILRTFVVLTFGRYLIRVATLSRAGALYARTFSFAGAPKLGIDMLTQWLNARNLILMLCGILVMIAVDILHDRGVQIRTTILSMPLPVRYAIYYAAIFLIIICGIYGKGYDAASFIYEQF